MITVTGRDTCKPAYIDEKLIGRIDELSEEIDGRAYPFPRVYIIDPKQKHDYFLDVIESANKIASLIEKANTEQKRRTDNE